MQRTLALAAAGLFLLALLTGGYVSGSMNGTLSADPHAALAAHLNGLMGCFLLLGVAWSLPLLHYKNSGRRWLGWTLIIAVYGNWAITAVKAWLHVKGVGLTGQWANDAVFILLMTFVVVPSIGTGVAWIAGFFGKSSKAN